MCCLYKICSYLNLSRFPCLSERKPAAVGEKIDNIDLPPPRQMYYLGLWAISHRDSDGPSTLLVHAHRRHGLSLCIFCYPQIPKAVEAIWSPVLSVAICSSHAVSIRLIDDSARAMMQSQTKVVLSKLSAMSSVPISAAPRATANNELSTKNDRAESRSDFSWTLDGLFGAFHCSKKRIVKIQRQHPGESERKEEVSCTIVRYRAPIWLFNRLWSVQATHASSGWTFSPRVHNVIPNDALVLKYIKADDIDGIQTLFIRREASPYDCDISGRSLLHVRHICII